MYLDQNDDTPTNIKLFVGNKELQMNEKMLNTWQKMLQFKMRYNPHDLKDYQKSCQLGDSILISSYDSTMITLTNGLSWNMDKGPPEEPKDFHRFLFDEEDRNRPEVRDRLKYLAFVTECNEQDQFAVDMIEHIKIFYSVNYPEDQLCLRVVYLFQPNEEGRIEMADRLVVKF